MTNLAQQIDRKNSSGLQQITGTSLTTRADVRMHILGM